MDKNAVIYICFLFSAVREYYNTILVETFSIQVAIIATSNTLLNIII